MKTASRFMTLALVAAFATACSSTPKQTDEVQSQVSHETTSVAESADAQMPTDSYSEATTETPADAPAVKKASHGKKSKGTATDRKKKKKKNRTRA